MGTNIGEVAVVGRIIAAFATTLLAALREVHGTEWCMNELVGPWRRQAGAAYPTNVVAHARPDSEVAIAFAARQFTAEFLSDHCAGCGGCELAQRVIRKRVAQRRGTRRPSL